MPELPEVETIARELARRLAGRTLDGVRVLRRDVVRGDPRPLEAILPGRRVVGVHRRAKRVVMELDGDMTLVFHLGMSGRLTVQYGDEAIERHTHLAIGFGAVASPPLAKGGLGGVSSSSGALRSSKRPPSIPPCEGGMAEDDATSVSIRESAREKPSPQPSPNGRGRPARGSLELRFRDPRRFGGVWCLTDREEHVGRRLGEVGIEPLEATSAAFRAVLSRSRQIKALLMDQHIIAGLGNIYCDEALHAAGIHPLRKAGQLAGDEVERLRRAIRTVLNKAIRFNGTTFMDYRTPNGEEGSFQRHHRVYQRDGEPCRTCATMIVRIKAVGRSTFLCPKCQGKKSKSRKVQTSKRRRAAAPLSR